MAMTEATARAGGDAHEGAHPGEIAIGVVVGRTSEFFDFFVYAIASVIVFPKLVFPFVNELTGTLYSFAIFALAFLARPVGTVIFMGIDRKHGKSAKLIIALFLLGTSTVAIAFLPGYDTIGASAIWLLALARGSGPGLGRRVGRSCLATRAQRPAGSPRLVRDGAAARRPARLDPGERAIRLLRRLSL